MADKVVSKFDKTFIVKGFQARIIKPASHNCCSLCKLIGHHPSSDLCLAKAPAEVQQTIQVFLGRDNPLSNIFVCPEGCAWGDDGTVFSSSEQEFQFEKVVNHRHTESSHKLIETDDTFKVKARTRELVPELSQEWLEKEE